MFPALTTRFAQIAQSTSGRAGERPRSELRVAISPGEIMAVDCFTDQESILNFLYTPDIHDIEEAFSNESNTAPGYSTKYTGGYLQFT